MEKRRNPVDEAIKRSALNARGKSIPRGLAGALAATMKDLRDSGMRSRQGLGSRARRLPRRRSSGKPPRLWRSMPVSSDNLRNTSCALLGGSPYGAPPKKPPKHPWIQQQQAVFLYGFYDLTGVQLDLVNFLWPITPMPGSIFHLKMEIRLMRMRGKLLHESCVSEQVAPLDRFRK